MAYHLIATAAIDQVFFLFSPNEDKNDAEKGDRQTEAYHTEELQSRPLPLECEDTTVLDALLDESLSPLKRVTQPSCLDESLRIELELVPDFYDEEAHRSEFAEAVAKKKFCSVNTTAILEDPGWRRVSKATCSISFRRRRRCPQRYPHTWNRTWLFAV